MKKCFVVILAVALLVWMRAGMRNAQTLSWHCRSVSLRYSEPLTADLVQAARREEAGLTFWCEKKIRLTASDRASDLTALLYLGDAALVWGQPCRTGAMPAQLDSRGCALSTAAAYELFGSENAVGLTVVWQDTEYVVRGIFENDNAVALLPDPTAGFTAAELGYTDDIRQDPETQIAAVLQRTGLPEPEWQLYPAEIQTAVRLMNWLPVLFAVPVLLGGMARLSKGWPVVLRDAAVFLVLLAAVLAMPVLFQSWPQWLTPSRWSDFTWWRQTFDQLREHFLVWLRLSPSCRDVCLKTALWLQLGIMAVQGILCEMLRCLLRPACPPATASAVPAKIVG